MLELFSDPEVYLSLLTLTLMEIVLGIDNIVFITILCGRLPRQRQRSARRLGIGVALISRLGLLFAINWVMGLTEPWFRLPLSEHMMTGQDVILLVGGVFLLAKATHEIYKNVEEPEIHHLNEPTEEEPLGPVTHDDLDPAKKNIRAVYGQILVQVIFLDIVFSLDSVITAVGMVDHLSVMAVAMVIAVGVMMWFAGPIGDFVQKTPSVRILALAFLILIGAMLVMEGTGQHVSKGYIYTAMGFALFVELINLRRQKKERVVREQSAPQRADQPD